MNKPLISLEYQGTKPSIDPRSYIAPTVVVVGDVTVGAQSSLWFGVIARGDINQIRIGQRTNIQDGTIVHVSRTGHGTVVGDDVTVGHMVVLHGCTLENGSFVGTKACVMDDALVESGAMVAAGALVTPGKVIRAGELWAGVPAKCSRQLKQEEVDMISWIPEHYVELAQAYAQNYTVQHERGSNK